MDVSTFVLFASNIALATATVFIKAPCPDAKLMPGFDMELYKGVWYEIAKYPDNWEARSDCGSIEYLGENKMFNLSNVVDGKRVNNLGTLRIGEEGLYHDAAVFVSSEGRKTIPSKILSTDYKEYSLVYTCVYNETTQMRHDFFWLVTRNRDKKDEVICKTADIIQSFGFIDTTKFVWLNTTKEHCLD